jgi:hypothetical protein
MTGIQAAAYAVALGVPVAIGVWRSTRPEKPLELGPRDAGTIQPSAYLFAARDRWERSGRASLGKERVTR